MKTFPTQCARFPHNVHVSHTTCTFPNNVHVSHRTCTFPTQRSRFPHNVHVSHTMCTFPIQCARFPYNAHVYHTMCTFPTQWTRFPTMCTLPTQCARFPTMCITFQKPISVHQFKATQYVPNNNANARNAQHILKHYCSLHNYISDRHLFIYLFIHSCFIRRL
jgi:hypothetical protein